MLGQDLVEDVVDGEGETRLVLEQLLHQQRVQVVRIHHIVPEITSYRLYNCQENNAQLSECDMYKVFGILSLNICFPIWD